MLLTSPGIKEIELNNNKVQFSIPNGWGIAEIRVIVPSDQIEEGRKRAEDLKMMIHPEEYLTFRDLQNIHYGMALQYLRDLMSSQ